MKKLSILLVALVFLFSLIGSAQAAYLDSFDNWTSSEVAKDWIKSSQGSIWGGQYNQIYAAGQGISCGGNGTNYKSVYRDIPVTAGVAYYTTVEAISNSTNVLGIRDGSYVKMWIQFNGILGNTLATYGTTGINLSDRYFSQLRVDGTAPIGATSARVILQVMGGTGGGTVFTNFNFYNSSNRVAGPDFIRNTEWLNPYTQQLWTMSSSGGGAGDYNVRPTSGSSQGISVGGTAGSYREIYRNFNIASYTSPYATKNQVSVYVVSNATNPSGEEDSGQVEVHMQFFDSKGRLLSGGSSVKGSQFGVNSKDPVKMTVEAPTPSGATTISILLRVLGGTGGGAVFDDFSLTTAY
ncbi:MAG: hypothetical protein HY776_02555 [Actinobacteria bacterium]|nr:hypothetical protein [Actinomycetota bacterium]